MNKIIFLACLLLLLPFGVLAAERSASEADLAAYKELSQARTDALKESLQKDMQAQTARIEAMDKLIERQDQLLDHFSGRFSDLLTFLALFGLVAGLLVYITVNSRAKKEARIAVEEWMEIEGPKAIEAKTKDLDSHIAAEKKAATTKREEYYSDIEKLHAIAADPLAEQQKQMSALYKPTNDSVQGQTLSKNSSAITKLTEALKHKPEADYGFDDWNARAHDAYMKGNLALAAAYWLQTARGFQVKEVRIAQSLFNAGVVLGQLNRSEEAIAVYDDVVSRYGNKPKAELRKQVARALNGKGFELLCRAKESWGDEVARLGDLGAAATLFTQAEKEMAAKFIVWGNQAYTAFLLGQADAVRPLLKQALQQGGEDLYKVTLGDLDIHPAPPDAEFRTLLEEVWAAVKQKA